jgi:hypothetical protein
MCTSLERFHVIMLSRKGNTAVTFNSHANCEQNYRFSDVYHEMLITVIVLRSCF